MKMTVKEPNTEAEDIDINVVLYKQLHLSIVFKSYIAVRQRTSEVVDLFR